MEMYSFYDCIFSSKMDFFCSIFFNIEHIKRKEWDTYEVLVT